ncbi:PspC domain-containing protein [Roseateles toxinivorans]|uniref:Phage shock protein C (PspC) family protein n=1 Tax=Roseateles toxinivorans TaxID=270368 RepID=A0A4R6QTJ1_9BURK|nr:PspC domain-containing protein [Roseateles toxinivorans]TDP74179.1 phage shock protein C (PspC) family protein [Roseateles toxinivorans]
MSIAEEIHRLDELRARGVLSEAEFQQAKARLLSGATPAGGGTGAPAVEVLNRFRRSRSDSWIGGVCGGLALITGLESWIWRLIFAVMFLFGGAGALLYILLWVFVPSD